MNADKVFNVVGSIIVLATITVLVVHSSGTSNVIGAFAGGLSQNLKTAMGN